MTGPAPLVLCGPSGAGKSTLLKKILEKFGNHFGFSVSHTTRKPRPGEQDGVAYHFVSEANMKEAISRGEFIEHATFAGNMYGTSKAAVSSVMEKGLICVLDIDVQGVQSMKQSTFSPNYIFIKPPSIEELRTRLQGRGTETDESLEKRINQAIKDMEYGEGEGNFDIVITNDDINRAYGELESFLLSKYETLLS